MVVEKTQGTVLRTRRGTLINVESEEGGGGGREGQDNLPGKVSK